jgi:thiol peroxidase
MQKRSDLVKFKGEPVTLAGNPVKAGDRAPDFTCATGLRDTLRLSQTPAKARLFSVVPSLDTGVCSIQTKKFSDALASLGDKVTCYTVSLDLPFAQGRFCTEKGIKNLQNLSDTHDGSFGKNYGVVMEGFAVPLLARAVFVVDKSGTVTHAEIVPEMTTEPNYDAALASLRAAAS